MGEKTGLGLLPGGYVWRFNAAAKIFTLYATDESPDLWLRKSSLRDDMYIVEVPWWRGTARIITIEADSIDHARDIVECKIAAGVIQLPTLNARHKARFVV